MSINNASEASAFLTGVNHSHRDLWDKITNTESYILHGEKPFDEDELESDGQEWVPNYNYGKGRAEIEQGVILNQTDIYRSFALVDIHFEAYSEKKHKDKIFNFMFDDYIKAILKRAISFSFIDCLEEDERVHPFISQIEYYSFTFGYCPVVRHGWNYLGDPVPLSSIGFQDRTKIGEVRDFVIYDVLKVDDIYSEYLRNKEREKKRVDYCGEVYHIYPNGWVEEGIFEVLKKKIDILGLDEDYEKLEKGKKPLVVETWDHIDNFISRMGLNYLTYNSSNIYIAKIFTWEDKNKYIETYTVADSPMESGLSHAEFVSSNQYLLYKKERKRTRGSEVLSIVKEFGVTNDSYISSLRGAGKFIADEALRYDTKRNTIEAKLMLLGSTLFRSSNSLSGKSAKIKVSHGFAFVDDDFAVVENQQRNDMTPLMASLQMENQEYEKRTAHLNPKLDLSSRPTKDEVQAKDKETGHLKRARVPIKLADYSRLFTECLYDLALKDYPEDENKIIQDNFYEYLKSYLFKYGVSVTDAQIKKIISSIKMVQLTPALGDPQAIREAMEFVGNSEQRRLLKIMYLLALGFSRKEAWSYVDEEDYGNNVDKAAAENQMFYSTSEVPAGRHQDPVSHLNIHYAKADRVIQGVVGGEDVVKGFNWLTNCLINTAKHLEFMETNPFYKKMFKQFMGIQRHFESKAKALAAEVQRLKQEETQRAEEGQAQAQQQQQQQGMDPKLRAELEADNIRMMEKIKRTNMLTENAMEKKREMFELQKELATESTRSNIEMQKEFAQLKKELALLSESVKLAKP